VMLLVLTSATLVGMYFGYWINLLAGFIFYFLASLWFTQHRYKFVDTASFIEAGADYWPRPNGY